MKVPKLIYLQVCGECQDNECEKCNFDDLAEITWCKDRINENDAVYFSEEHVREVLKHVVEDANTLISCARQSAVFTTKLDGDKYIPHVIELLKKGNEK